MKKFFSLVGLCILILLPKVHAQGGAELTTCQNYLISIRTNRGDVLFPEAFFRLKINYENLLRQTEGRPLTNGELSEARLVQQKLEELDRAAIKVKPFLNSVLDLRDQAVLNGAQDFTPDLFQDAEKRLQHLARQLVTSNTDESEKQIIELAGLYRKCQFETIRNKLLSEVRILVQESRDLDAEKLTPRTFSLVRELLSEVEDILRKKNFNDPTLQEKATVLSAESQHLLFLAQTARRIKRQDGGFEEFALNLEKSIEKLARLLNYSPDFSNGSQPVLENIKISITDLVEENRRLREQVDLLDDSLRQMKNQSFRLSERLKSKKSISEKIDAIRPDLEKRGVKVTESNDQLVLRFNGIRFQPGKIKMETREQTLLEAVGRALRRFPTGIINLRLTQSTDGDPVYSQSLLEQRAKSCALIIQTSGYIPDDRLKTEARILPGAGVSSYVVMEVFIPLTDRQLLQ